MPLKGTGRERLGPHSRPGKLAMIDKRRVEAKLMKEVTDDLTAHCGGNPSVTQRLIIEQVAILSLRLRLLDKAAIEDTAMSERNARSYLAWCNTRTRLLRQLGLQAPPARKKTLDDIIAARSAKGATT